MKYKIKFLPSANEDLKMISDWYVIKFGKNSARILIKNIYKNIQRLESFPESGSLTPYDDLNESGYRMVLCEKYVAIYRFVDEAVYIYHVADTRREYNKLF